MAAKFFSTLPIFASYFKLFKVANHQDDGDNSTSITKPHDHNISDNNSKAQDQDVDDMEVPAQVIPESNHKGVSFPRTCFNTTNALTGIGVLSMPYALSLGGWLSLPFFFLIAVVFCYTGHLIQRCMDSDRSINSYVDIAHAAFGYKGKMAIAIIMYFELYISAVSHLIMEGDNLDKLFPNTSIHISSLSIEGKQLFIFIAALVILPTTWLRNLGILAYFSAVGVFVSFILIIIMLLTGITETGFHAKGKLFNLSGLPIALGLYSICFCGHAVFPTIYTSMKNKTRFSKVLQITFSIGTINCGLVAICGYLMYGDGTQSQVTLNLPDGKWYSRIALCAMIVTPFTKYAWVITPIAIAFEERFTTNGREKPSILFRTFLVIGTVVIAIAVPFFGYIMAFIGSFLGIIVSVLLPCVCYLKIFKVSTQCGKELAKIIFILVFGTIVCFMGTYSSVREIIQKL